jgi:hypothetical protein
MNMTKGGDSLTSSYACNIFGILLERIFMVLQEGKHYKRFIGFARKGTEKGNLAAANEFRTVWKIIARELYNANAHVTLDEAIAICKQFFFDPDDSSRDYSSIAIDILFDDQASFLTYRRKRSQLEMEEEFHVQALEVKNDLIREDLLRSLIQLAFLPTKLLPDSPHLVDRQKATFSENLHRLVMQYLPPAGINTSVEELKHLLVAEIPKLKTRSSFLVLIDNYEGELSGEEVIELTEEIVVAPVESVEIRTVVIDGTRTTFTVGAEKIDFTAKGILTAISRFHYSPENEQEFRDNIVNLLTKILEELRGEKVKALNDSYKLLGDYRIMLYEIKKILEKSRGRTKEADLTSKQRKLKAIVDVIIPVEACVSELMPMSLRARTQSEGGIRIQDPAVTG